MNTSQWGPKLWRYLHTTAQSFNSKNKIPYQNFFVVLQDLLPCKWCRLSYQGFLTELPLTAIYLQDNVSLQDWLYQIHNKVNDKLRGQGLLQTGNPKFLAVYNKYDRILKDSQTDPQAVENMWYSLHAMAHNYDPLVHNRKSYREFFTLVGETMPYKKIKPLYKKLLKEDPVELHLKSQKDLTEWLYQIHSHINEKLGKNMPSYNAVLNKFESIKADCRAKKTKIPSKNNVKNNTNNTNNIHGKTVTVGTCRIPDSSQRCKANTKRGRQCIRNHIGNSSYCIQHVSKN